MAPPAARKPPGKGKTPKPDLRKRKTGKKKDEDGKPDAERKETAEERSARKKAAKEARKAKGESVLSEGGTRPCKICQKLRKGTSACDPCCSSRAARGTDHDATALRKSAKEVRAERKEKRKREEEEARKNKKQNASSSREETTVPAAEGNAAAKAATLTDVKSNAIDFGAVARFDPDAASSSDSESTDPTRDDETIGDDGETIDASKNDASSKEASSVLASSVDDQKAAEAQLRKRQIYLGGVPFHKTTDEIRSAFEEENLPVEKIDCMTFPDSGRFRGIAILTFATRDAAKGALAWNGEEWDGTFLTVKKYAPKEGKREEDADGGGGGGGAPTRSRLLGEVKKTEGQRVAFVCNLSWDVTEQTLRSALAGCEVADVRMGVDKETGHFKGFAHVEFATDTDLERAVALNGASVLGRPMKIAYATARKEYSRDGDSATAGRGGRGGRGGGGRGRGRGGGGRVAKKE